MTFYESDADFGELEGVLGDFLKKMPLRSGVTADEAIRTIVGAADQNYTAMLRFRLVDKEQRTFVAERFCFRGSIDDWIFLSGPKDIKKQIETYLKLLGTDKLFDSPLF